MTSYLQAIEFTTSRIDEAEVLIRARRAETGSASSHGRVTACRGRPNTYVTIVESEVPEPGVAGRGATMAIDLAEELAALCDIPPTLYDLQSRTVPRPRAPGRS
jgi:nitrogenase subunit NifH